MTTGNRPPDRGRKTSARSRAPSLIGISMSFFDEVTAFIQSHGGF